jgi:hypothetical protein
MQLLEKRIKRIKQFSNQTNKKMDLLQNYTQLNNSFRKKKLIFRLGENAGFFSEYNNMILAMLYCLENKIRFVLSSKDAFFCYDRGWIDYFLPFCTEDWLPYQRHNPRCAVPTKKYDPRVILHHLLRPNTFLTFELWDRFRDREQEKQHFLIPELGIDGGLQEACRVLIDLTWKYNASTQTAIDGLTDNLHIPTDYIGLHIRSGDKSQESQLLSIREYVEKAKTLSELRRFFVLTDDYRSIKEMQETYPEYDIYTLCGEDERGYFHQNFVMQEKRFIRQSHEKLFASVDILSRAQVFIGTFTSNPGMFLGMRMPADKSFSIDVNIKKWEIW